MVSISAPNELALSTARPDRVRDVVQFQIKKNAASEIAHFAHDVRSGGDEKLQADLEQTRDAARAARASASAAAPRRADRARQ